MTVEPIHAPPSPDGSEGLLALVVTGKPDGPGIRFVTDPHACQQVGYLSHPAGHIIPAHVHPPLSRHVTGTQETIVICSGRLRVDLYTSAQVYVTSRTVEAGDVLVLVSGGHGFLCLTAVEAIEIRGGPYAGVHDKVRFAGVRGGAVSGT